MNLLEGIQLKGFLDYKRKLLRIVIAIITGNLELTHVCLESFNTKAVVPQASGGEGSITQLSQESKLSS